MFGSPVDYPFEDLDFGESRVRAFVCFPKDFPYFAGHFPENPVLPGICMVEASLALLRLQAPDLSLDDIELKKCRFANIVRPDQRIFLEGVRTADGWSLFWFDGSPEGKVMAQVNVVLV